MFAAGLGCRRCQLRGDDRKACRFESPTRVAATSAGGCGGAGINARIAAERPTCAGGDDDRNSGRE
jgi:hypothetical protein